MNRLEQFRVLTRAIRNWPLAVVDLTGARKLVRYTTRSGSRVWCRSRTTDVAEVALVLGGNEYPRELLELDPQATVLDLGANIGSFCLLVGEVNRGGDYRGVAFEPFASSCALLQRNLRENAITSFTVEEAAISSVDGVVSLRTDLEPDRVHISEDGDVNARSWRLSTYCRERGIDSIDLLKVDIEGGEYDLFKADLDFLSSSVESILLEFHDLDDRRNHGALLESLRPAFDARVLHTRGLSGVIHAQRRTQISTPPLS